MKNLLFFAIVVCGLSSCIKNKEYQCECVYVAGFTLPQGTPNKIETHTVEGRIREQAADNCHFDYQGKYDVQGYSGTCTLK